MPFKPAFLALGFFAMTSHAQAPLIEQARAAESRGEPLRAYFLYRSAAEQGDAEAAYALGHYLQSGQHVVQDLPAALHWYSQAADAGIPGADTAYGELDDLATPDEHALRSRAIRGDADAMRELAHYYRQGHHFIHDPHKAAHWQAQARLTLERAAAQGDIRALVTLAEDSPSAEALPLLQQALSLSSDDRQMTRAILHDLGELALAGHDLEGLARYQAQAASHDLAAHYAEIKGLIHLARREYAQAQAALADLKPASPRAHYALGVLHERAGDNDAARNHFQHAAAYADKYETAAILWQHGANPDIARAEYRLAQLDARAGHPDAARQWLAQAAARGLSPAQYRLAQAFIAEKDWLAARYWLEEAAARAHPDALRALAELYDAGHIAPDAGLSAAETAKALRTRADSLPAAEDD